MADVYFKNLILKALIITIADDILCNNFLHFWYLRIDLNQMKRIEK